MTEHEVWSAAFGRHMDRGDHAAAAAGAANAAVDEYRAGPLGSAGRCENELCPGHVGRAAQQWREANPAIAGFWGEQPINGATAKQRDNKLCEDEGCPQHGTPHLCVDLEALKRSTVLHDEDPPVPGVYMTCWNGGHDLKRHWDGRLWSLGGCATPGGKRQEPRHVAYSRTQWRCLILADSEVAKPQPTDVLPQVAAAAKQVAEFHEQAAAAKQPRFKFGDRVLVSPVNGPPFYATAGGCDENWVHCHISFAGRCEKFPVGWVKHAPEVSHDQC